MTGTVATAPELSDISGWLNSPPLLLSGLRGKVVFLDFWTFGCINCQRTIPHMGALYQKFKGTDLVIIGVHTPEFDSEKDPENVASAVKRLCIEYPVALDTENTTWKLYGNRYWPRQALIDYTGKLRYEHIGEGAYDEIEEQVAGLLAEAGAARRPGVPEPANPRNRK